MKLDYKKNLKFRYILKKNEYSNLISLYWNYIFNIKNSKKYFLKKKYLKNKKLKLKNFCLLTKNQKTFRFSRITRYNFKNLINRGYINNIRKSTW